MWIIYKISNCYNDKLYIGITSLPSALARWEKHKENRRQLNDKFHVAISKLGPENFDVEEIDYCESKEEAGYYESYWIEQFDSFNSGYNSSLGGEGVRCLQEQELHGEVIVRKGPEKEIPTWALNDSKIKEHLIHRFPTRFLAGRFVRIIYLYYRMDSTASSIAEELGVSVRAVREVLRRANKTMDRPLKTRGRPRKGVIIGTSNGNSGDDSHTSL